MEFFRKATASLGNVLPSQVTNLLSEDKKKEAKNVMREKLLPLVQKINPALAEKITDILLEKVDPVEVHSLVTDQAKLQQVVNEEAKKLEAESSSVAKDLESTGRAQVGVQPHQISISALECPTEYSVKAEESENKGLTAEVDRQVENPDMSLKSQADGDQGAVTGEIGKMVADIGVVVEKVQEVFTMEVTPVEEVAHEVRPAEKLEIESSCASKDLDDSASTQVDAKACQTSDYVSECASEVFVTVEESANEGLLAKAELVCPKDEGIEAGADLMIEKEEDRTCASQADGLHNFVTGEKEKLAENEGAANKP